MDDWGAFSEPVLGGRGLRLAVRQGSREVTYDAALALMADSMEFRTFLTRQITAASCKALRFETPPITLASVHRSFEFVLVDDPFLEMDPQPDVFGPHFDAHAVNVDVLAVPNLGATAKLVVPRQLSDPSNYVHLKSFLRRAPTAQVHSLWKCVARTAREELTDRPLWISTAGGGVSWLHVRLENEPKYYSYRPYALLRP